MMGSKAPSPILFPPNTTPPPQMDVIFVDPPRGPENGPPATDPSPYFSPSFRLAERLVRGLF